MDVAFDVETMKKDEEGNWKPILDATGKHFILGCIYKETGGKKVFTDKKEMWNYLIALGRKEEKRKKKLTAYAHNIQYDFYNIAELEDPNISWFSDNPFIVTYYETKGKIFQNIEEVERWKYYAYKEGIRYEFKKWNYVEYKRELIKFVDTMSLFRMSLARLGSIIGIEKTEMPTLIQGRITKKNIKELAEYCMNDCKITLTAGKMLKEKLQEDGISIRNICTINQIAIDYVLQKLMKEPSEHLLQYHNGIATKNTHKTKYAKEIHEAYRASLTRVWKVGVFNNVTDIDANSLYPYSLMKLEYLPDLRTERRIENPLEEYTEQALLEEIGISRVLIYNKQNTTRILPVRTIDNSYLPKQGTYMIGTYTHMELKKAVREGYEIKHISWSIIWDKAENTLRKIYEELYDKRINKKNDFDYYFYKAIMNSSIGKFGQRRTNQELFIDSIESAEAYQKINSEIIRGIEGTRNVMYKRILDDKPKKYYAPIIPALITAQARMIMYEAFKKIPEGDLLYSDTDSILMKGEHLNKFIIGEHIGEWKIEKDVETKELLQNKECIIWGSKAKAIGNNIAVAGANKKGLTLEQFKKGKVVVKRMLGIKNTQGKETGTFIEEERDLTEQKSKWEKTQEVLGKEMIYIDYGLNSEDIKPFIPYIKGITLKNNNGKV